MILINFFSFMNIRLFSNKDSLRNQNNIKKHIIYQSED